jgi:hypothetical protein
MSPTWDRPVEDLMNCVRWLLSGMLDIGYCTLVCPYFMTSSYDINPHYVIQKW